MGELLPVRPVLHFSFFPPLLKKETKKKKSKKPVADLTSSSAAASSSHSSSPPSMREKPTDNGLSLPPECMQSLLLLYRLPPKNRSPLNSIAPKPPLITISKLAPKLPSFVTKPRNQTTTCLPPIPTPTPSQNSKSLVKLITEKALVCLLGAFFFVGSLGLKAGPGLASPAKAGSFSAGTEEREDTQIEKNERVEMYERILEREPQNLEAAKVVVQEKMRRGELREAVKYVERLIRVEPDEVEWRLLEALCHEMMGELIEAKRLLEEILEGRPLLLRALHGLAMIMHKNGDGPAVFDMLNNALAVASREKRVTEERNISILIAQMYVVKGELEEGFKKFQDLINENPRDFRPYLCLGIIYSLLDRPKEAAENFETYQILVPEEFPQRPFLDYLVVEAMNSSPASASAGAWS